MVWLYFALVALAVPGFLYLVAPVLIDALIVASLLWGWW